MERFTFVELFAGIGGFRVGLEAIGGECIWACELNTVARLVYQANFGRTPYYDVTKADYTRLPHFDLLTAGFPCQDFSTLGDQEGLDGSRGALFFEVVKVLRKCRPECYILENVKGLLTMQDGKVLQTVISAIQAEGYSVTYKLINSSCLVCLIDTCMEFMNYAKRTVRSHRYTQDLQSYVLRCDGAAQSILTSIKFRNRVYICGFKDPDAAIRFRFLKPPEFQPPRKVKDILHDEEEEPFLDYFKLSWPQWKNVKRSPSVRKYGIQKRLCSGDMLVADTLVSNYRNSVKSVSQFVAPQGYSWESEKVEARPRWFSPRECSRLMGFPEWFKLYPKEKETYSQLGNAVTPPVIAIVGGSCIAALKKVPLQDDYIKEVIRAAIKLVFDSTGNSKKKALLHKHVVVTGVSGSLETSVQGLLAGDKDINPPQERGRVWMLVAAWILTAYFTR